MFGWRRTAPALSLGVLLLLLASADAQVRDLDQSGLQERVFYDGPGPSGELTGGMILLPLAMLPAPGSGPAMPATTIVCNGPSFNRIDITCVGDGYLSSQLGLYASHVSNAVKQLFAEEPFATYMTLFNVHRVDVVSNESGVDNDPVQGILRDTALDMGFWCSGIERLLCVNVSLAYLQAQQAPDVDHVLAIANSSKYGGAGYTSSDLATFSGGNPSSTEVAIHEIGHSLGNLADEYHYSDGAVYTGSEPVMRNISIFTEPEMQAADTKWADWLMEPGVSTYEGAFYHQYGIYRPTFNSKMRSLGQPFNAPSSEGLVIEMYKLIHPIDDSTPLFIILEGSESVFVDPVDPVGHTLDVQWFLDGAPIFGAQQNTLDLSTLPLVGEHQLSVTVTDPTSFVRDEVARNLHMSETLDWWIEVPSPVFVRGDLNDNGTLDVSDAVFGLTALFVRGAELPGCLDSADINDDGLFNIADPITLLSHLFVVGSPPPHPPFPECGQDPTLDAGNDLGCLTFAECS